MVKEGEEAERWKALSYAYMTEESDDSSDSNIIITHKLPWRSDSESCNVAVVNYSSGLYSQP